MAMVSPRMPAPDPPSSSGRHKPSIPASLKAEKRSAGIPRIGRSLGPRLDLVPGQPPDRVLERREFVGKLESTAAG